MSMSGRTRKLLSYYKPHLALFFGDMFFALLAAGITLVFPMIVRYITNNVLVNYEIGEATPIILRLLLGMLALALLEYVSMYFIAYQGHIMGARMEFNMRNDLFEHFQKLSFNYYDNQKTGQLMSRITNDLFDISELCHHGPEDIVISIIKMVGAFVILMNINVPLTLLIFAFLPPMFAFAYFMRGRMSKAFRKNRERIAEINARVEDNLSGIRVVKSFANEEIEIEKFNESNSRFVESKRNSYWNMAGFHSGLTLFTSFINIAMIAGGSIFISKGVIGIPDLLTFLLYVNTLIDPVKKLISFTETFQNGMTGFERFYDILMIMPDIVDKPHAVELHEVAGRIEFKNVAFKYNE
ncbi:MAG: ywjA, partial [Herbinix sp.]|nr:ywjA [Herbinix sp.]